MKTGAVFKCSKWSLSSKVGKVLTPLLSDGAEKKNFPNTLMVPPNSLGQMLKFGTSNKKK